MFKRQVVIIHGFYSFFSYFASLIFLFEYSYAEINSARESHRGYQDRKVVEN